MQQLFSVEYLQFSSLFQMRYVTYIYIILILQSSSYIIRLVIFRQIKYCFTIDSECESVNFKLFECYIYLSYVVIQCRVVICTKFLFMQLLVVVFLATLQLLIYFLSFSYALLQLHSRLKERIRHAQCLQNLIIFNCSRCASRDSIYNLRSVSRSSGKLY